jgi:hypothetical protein
MNIDEPRESSSTEEGQVGDDERVEVLVEDLFIEEFQTAPPPEPRERAKAMRARASRAIEPVRGRTKSLMVGLLALGGLALATLFVSGRPRKASMRSRLLRKIGIRRRS